jgi:hypothetical protein
MVKENKPLMKIQMMGVREPLLYEQKGFVIENEIIKLAKSITDKKEVLKWK